MVEYNKLNIAYLIIVISKFSQTMTQKLGLKHLYKYSYDTYLENLHRITVASKSLASLIYAAKLISRGCFGEYYKFYNISMIEFSKILKKKKMRNIVCAPELRVNMHISFEL